MEKQNPATEAQCPCITWVRDGVPMFTKHHAKCPQFNALDELMLADRRLMYLFEGKQAFTNLYNAAMRTIRLVEKASGGSNDEMLRAIDECNAMIAYDDARNKALKNSKETDGPSAETTPSKKEE